ncbi:MAG: hypothetical protein WBQ37_05305 [Candidatus Competibacter sp.]
MLIELSPVLSRFAERTPLPVLARAVLKRCLNPQHWMPGSSRWPRRSIPARYCFRRV